MNEAKTGGPAFPQNDATVNRINNLDGMSLRDYFAGQALYVAHQYEDCHVNAERLAMHAYNIADALLAERSK
jgi:hypothetical protein